jgi:glycosyltransferase involved in cell wall biosynthesis
MEHLAIVTNLMTPATAPVYEVLAGRVPRVTVLLTGHEDNRTWTLKSSWSFAVKQVRGVVIKRNAAKGSRTSDTRYFHIPVGLLSALVRCRPDVVISNEMGLRTFVAWLYCFFRRIPIVVHWEGTPHNQSRIGWVRRMARRLVFCRLPRAWIACGSESQRYLVSLGVPADRIVLGAYSVDTKRFSVPATPFETFKPRPVLLTVGRFVRLKGLQEYLRAVSVLQREGFEFTTLLVGGGPEKEALCRLSGELGLRHVEIRDFVEPYDLPAVYAAADVHVFPTLCDGWGIVVAEAIAAGLPVLSSVFAGATVDLVPEDWRFDPTDEAGFVESLRRAISVGRIGRDAFPSLAELPDVGHVADVYLLGIDRADFRS